MLAVAAAPVGETRSDYASRAILAAAAKDVPGRWPEAGGGPRRRQKPGQPPQGRGESVP